ncbi:MAG: helix-hairpin-helix domain-containing protein [Spirosomataceae bacterium]
MYGLQPALYERLEPYTFNSRKTTATNNSSPIFQCACYSHQLKPANLPKNQFLTTFDINSADTTQLIRLKGIGSKLAARIIKFRDGLGGFASSAQYTEVYGLDSLALSELGRFAEVRTPVKNQHQYRFARRI